MAISVVATAVAAVFNQRRRQAVERFTPIEYFWSRKVTEEDIRHSEQASDTFSELFDAIES